MRGVIASKKIEGQVKAVQKCLAAVLYIPFLTLPTFELLNPRYPNFSQA